MTRNTYRAGTPGDVRTERDGDRWTLVFVRDLPHPPDAIWSALTDPNELRAWAPFDADRDLGRRGDATLVMAGTDEPESTPCTVTHADRPRLLVYTWGEDVLRWELERRGSGTRLTLRHTVTDRSWLSKVAAGWHICFDVMDRSLTRDPIGRIVADDAHAHGWDDLERAYADRLSTS